MPHYIIFLTKFSTPFPSISLIPINSYYLLYPNSSSHISLPLYISIISSSLFLIINFSLFLYIFSTLILNYLYLTLINYLFPIFHYFLLSLIPNSFIIILISIHLLIHLISSNYYFIL